MGLAFALVLTILPAHRAAAGQWDAGASAGAELRVFPESPLQSEQLETFQPSAILEGDIRWRSSDRKHQFAFVPFLRVDAGDDARTHGDIREAYYRFISDDQWTLLVGIAKVFWGKTESRHLVDIINQDDAIEDIDGEDKLGQPMVQLGLQRDWGRIELFALPGFRERTFPGRDGRLRTEPRVSRNREIFEASAGRGHVDFAARYSHYFGGIDLGLSVFHGTSREPRLLQEPGETDLTPVYDLITQGSADIQYTSGAWLWKFEGIVREGQGDVFFASVAGFEYTLYQILDRAWDLGLLAEHLYDGRDDHIVPFAGGFTTASPVTPFDNDIFVGGRLALNDTQDTSVLAGTITDLKNGSTVMLIEAETRLGQNWKAELETRLFMGVDTNDNLAPFRRDDFVTLRMTRYF